MTAGKLLILGAFANEAIRSRFTSLIRDLHAQSDFLSPYCFASRELEFGAELESLTPALERHYSQPEPFAIVVSDQLVDQGLLAEKAKEILDPHLCKPIATIAITDFQDRVANIDRIVTKEAPTDELKKALERVSARLRYLGTPPCQKYPYPFIVRRIDGEFELQKYFRLRHSVYTVMGYLNEQKECVTCGMEIDGCDAAAIHLGAYEKGPGYESLRGTARLLLANAPESESADCTNNLLCIDPILKTIVEHEVLSLMLPVFQSQQLNEHLEEMFLHNLVCAELSRVIVVPEFRGAGLSRRLIETAICEARRVKVNRMYLECLPIHVPLYAKFGFKLIPGTGGVVIGVGRSMVAMILEFPNPGDDDTAVAAPPA